VRRSSEKTFSPLWTLCALASLVGPVAAAARVGHADVVEPALAQAVALSTPLAAGPSTGHGGKGETINVVIPPWEGALMMTVSDAPVQLSSKALSAERKTVGLTGELPVMTIEDYRYVSQPGWLTYR